MDTGVGKVPLGLAMKKGGEEERLKKRMPKTHQGTSSARYFHSHHHASPKAPRDLLIALKQIFETFPGSEKVQLNIGGKIVPVPMTITVSPVLDKKVEEAVGKYS